MAAVRKEEIVVIVCANCGSDDVSRDAWADWNVVEQEWVLRVAFDYAHCHCCEEQTSLREALLGSAASH